MTAVDTSIRAAKAATRGASRTHRTATGVTLAVLEGATGSPTDSEPEIEIDHVLERVLDAAREQEGDFPLLLRQMEYIAILLVRRGIQITHERLYRMNPDHPNSCARCGPRKLAHAVFDQYDMRGMRPGDRVVITTSWGQRFNEDPNDFESLEHIFRKIITRVLNDPEAYFSVRVGSRGRRS